MLILFANFAAPKFIKKDLNCGTNNKIPNASVKKPGVSKNTPDIKISFEDVEVDFESVFNNPNSQKSDIVTIIKKYVPDFMHIETGKHLDQKM